MSVLEQHSPGALVVTCLGVERRLQIAIAAGLLLIVAGVLIGIMQLCDGHLIYSLDDPYISLSLGWHIGHGHYGINPGEAASPSSSILYPFVLAAFAWASWQDWVPLVMNTLAAIGTGLLFGAALGRYGIVNRAGQAGRGAAFVIVLCVAINTVGLVFDGLEHSLHALTSVFVVLALARALEDGRVPASLIIAIIVLPLWRFEGIALAGLAGLALAVAGHRRAAAIALAGVAACLGAYMLAMHALGLPLLPSSVLSKSQIAQHAVGTPAGLVASVIGNATANLAKATLPFWILIALVVAHPVWRALRRGDAEPPSWSLHREIIFALVIGGALTAHMLFGAWDWFARYEAYALALGAAGAIVLWRRPLAWMLARRSPVLDGLAIAALLSAGQIYAFVTLGTPLAAHGIYQQQYQLHRFVDAYYRRPVAVNDLGLVSYRNPNYVLDLWGLGSEAARQARLGGDDPDWMDRLAQDRHVGLAMIFDAWFAGQIPAHWRRLAVLRTPKGPTLASDNVEFYATADDAVAPAMQALREFRGDLIPGTSLTILDPATAPPQQ